MATRVEMSSSLFKKDFKEKETGNVQEKENMKKWNLMREECYNTFEESALKLKLNDGNNPILIPVSFWKIIKTDNIIVIIL